MEVEKTTSNRKWAIVIGLGLALSPIHNQYITEITSIGGRATLFLPAIGYVIWILGVMFFCLHNWKDLSIGDRKIFIPLVILVVAIGISGFVNGETFNSKIAPLFMGVVLLACYVVARHLGSDIFLMLLPFVIIGIIVSIILGIINPGTSEGGLLTNYCASAGYLIFGALVIQGKYQWALIIAVLIGVFFIGALEAVFILGVLGITVLIRRDFNRNFIIASGVLVGLVGLWLALGFLTPLYEGNQNIAVLIRVITGEIVLDDWAMKWITSGRWEVIVDRLQHINMLGHGYNLGIDLSGTVHNLPLIIMHQIGPLGAIAWSVVTLYCLIKTKWTYAWVGVIAMCVFDHYIWTQFAPFWWILVGVSTTSNIKSDLIFRRKNE